MYFSDIPVTRTTIQTHVGLYLGEKLNYNTQIKEKLGKVYEGIGLLRNLSNKLPRQALVTIYNVFTRPHLDYGDIVYNKLNKNHELFINETEKVQYAALVKTLVQSKGHLWKNSMQNLGLNLLKFRQWFRKLACFYKIQSTGLRKYLLQLIPTNNHSYFLRKPLN